MTRKSNVFFRNLFVLCMFMSPLALVCSPAFAADEPIIIDHMCTDISQIPDYWINQAKAMFKLSYGHTSHGSQIVTGMSLLRGESGSLYWYDHNGTAGGLSLHDREPSGDLGNPDRTTWAARTRNLLDTPGCDRNMIMWSWCGQVNGTEEEINTYLSLMNDLETDYPDVTFVYMTGHLNGTGEDGNVNIRNNQIRDYCTANNKILFDFADIESYDPDGNYFLDRRATDSCDYNGGNWADEWYAANPGECASCYCAHSRCLNCQLKGKAFWYMMARLAGWNKCLPSPSDLTAAPDSISQQIDLSWTDNSSDPNEDYFIIQRQVDGGAWDNSYDTAAIDTTSYIDTGLAFGTYNYRVAAHLNDDGTGNPCDSGPSNEASSVISQQTPAAPSNLTSELNGFDITLNWTDNSDNEENFILERKVDSGGYSVLGTIPADTETYDDIGVPPLHTYTYQIKAINNFGDSEYSNETSEYIAEEEYTISLKQGVDGYTGCKDAYLDSAHADSNYGATPYKHVLNDPKCNFVISFDMPSEVMEKKILDAKLVFYCWSVGGWQADQYLDLYRMAEEWVEESVTWNKKSTGSNWTTPGGAFDPALLAGSLIPVSSYYPEFDITGLVQKWVDATNENFGVLLKNDSVVDTGIKAGEYSEYGRPYLEITYTNKPGCTTDFDGDNDVDGSDMASFAAVFDKDCLETFAGEFGGTDCMEE